MRYEGSIYRPPSEAWSYLLQVTIGCAHNDCTFCGMFKDKKFRVRKESEVMEDIDMARNYYRSIKRIFLCDGDALCLATDKIMRILNKISETIPECERVGIYGYPRDVLNKSEEDLIKLRDAGLKIIYIGAESGSDKVLKKIKKGVTRAEIIEAVKKVESLGIAASVTFINGLGGVEDWEEHAIETGKAIGEMNASYVGVLTLMLEPGAPLLKDVNDGNFTVLSGEQIVAETHLMLKHANCTGQTVFRSNHASNYVNLAGTLPKDKDMMMAQLERAMNQPGFLKDERFRAL